jgi:hypothetical protein
LYFLFAESLPASIEQSNAELLHTNNAHGWNKLEELV